MTRARSHSHNNVIVLILLYYPDKLITKSLIANKYLIIVLHGSFASEQTTEQNRTKSSTQELSPTPVYPDLGETQQEYIFQFYRKKTVRVTLELQAYTTKLNIRMIFMVLS